jgi:molybdopterin molybdotransferase
MISLEEAWDRVAAEVGPLPFERVPMSGAAGRILAEDARAVIDLPPFDRSAMDGFAVRAADTQASTPLRLAGEIAAGEIVERDLEPATALGITTGAALPPGADAVLRSERAAVADGHVTPTEPVAPGRNVRYRGEDVRAGDVLAGAGAPLTVQKLASLASAGVGDVAVHRRARVHVLVTGSELLAPGTPPRPGHIYESNGLVLRTLAERTGAEVVDHGVVEDAFEPTRAAVAAGLQGDVLIASGGVSVGPHDHVKPAFDACGVEERFWRVRLRPGKPLWFGRREDTLVFGLPGNPLSTLVCFLLFIDPALRRLHGEGDAVAPLVPGRLAAPATATDGRTTFLTARIERAVDGTLEATPTERQGSHMTGVLGDSDGFVVAPHDAGELPAGAAVELLVL